MVTCKEVIKKEELKLLLNEVKTCDAVLRRPPTSKNLSWFSDKYGIHSRTIFDAALNELEISYCLYLQRGDYIVLLPGHIHGILSGTASAVAGVLVVHNDFRPAADKCMEWGLNFAGS